MRRRTFLQGASAGLLGAATTLRAARVLADDRAASIDLEKYRQAAVERWEEDRGRGRLYIQGHRPAAARESRVHFSGRRCRGRFRSKLDFVHLPWSVRPRRRKKGRNRRKRRR